MEEQKTNELWVNQFFNQEHELFFQFQEEAEYPDTISSFALSHHGYIISIGFSTGEIFACDSRNFCNKHEYTTHKGEVTAISFSRDSLHLASGDKAGFFQIHNVVIGVIEYTNTFSSPIKSIISSNYDVNVFLILLADGSLFLFNLKTETCNSIDQKFSSIVWGTDAQSFIGGFKREVIFCQIDEEKSTISISDRITALEKSKESIISISSNNDKTFLLLLDSRGVGNIFSLDCRIVIGTYADTVNRMKYSYASYSYDDRYIFMVNKTTSAMTFVAYTNPVSGVFIPTPIHSFRGLKEPVRDIIQHPTHPIIFVRLKYEIYSWSYYNLTPLYNSVPEKGLMKRNADFVERESEFDSSDCEEEEEAQKKFKYKPLKLMKREPEGVLNIFPDDYKYPNQIYFLPYQHQNISLKQT